MSDLFERECEAAIQFGLTYDEYWLGDCEILYYKAKQYKAMDERQMQLYDTLAWMVGSYVEVAVGDVISAAFSKHRTSSKYPKQPQFYTKDTGAEKMKNDELEIQRSYTNFMSFVAMKSNSIGR